MKKNLEQSFPMFADAVNYYKKGILELSRKNLILRLFLITFSSVLIVWDIAVQTPMPALHLIALWIFPEILFCLVFLPVKPLYKSKSWYFRIVLLALFIGVLFFIWDELKWIYTGSSDEAIRTYADYAAWIIYWTVPSIIYIILRIICGKAVKSSKAVSGFISGFAENVRQSNALQIMLVLIYTSVISLSFVLQAAAQIPMLITHEYWLLLVPFVFWSFILLPSRPLRSSPFWILRLIILALYTGEILMIMDYTVKSTYAGATFEYLNAYSDYPRWFIAWFIPAVIYYAIRSLIYRLCEKEKKTGILIRDTGILWSPFLKIEKKDNHRGAVLRSVLLTIPFLLVISITATGIYLMRHFPNMDIEAVAFTVQFANGSFSSEVRKTIILIVGAVVLAVVLFFILSLRRESASRLTLKSLDGKTEIECDTSRIRSLHRILPLLAILACGLFLLGDTLNLGQFIYNRLNPSLLYENHYIEPSPDIIHFPEKKKNIIYVYMESYENTFSSIENGGNQTVDYMPQLEQLAYDNLNFSHRDGIGGQSVFFPTVGYTMSSTVAQTGGIPLTTAIGDPHYELLSDPAYNSIVPSLVRLEDILYDAGYNQLFIRGENTSFAGYNTYVGLYPTSTIWDAETAKTDPCMTEEPQNAWGVEDRLLFPVIKEKIRELAAQDAPFCVTAYTVDTHSYEGGFRCDLCDSSIELDYAAAVECSNRIVSEFVHWLENEPYGDDTVVILVGDHLADKETSALRWNDDGYIRTTYNCFVHAQKTPVKSDHRVFTAMDMFPTTLSAIGVTIDGDRLGLGTDLFSATPTLCEEMGSEAFVKEVQQSSRFYNAHFWQAIDGQRNVYGSHS